MGALCRVFDFSLSYMEISHVNSLHVFQNTPKDQKKVSKEMRDVMARMIGAKCVELDVSHYCDFYDYYYS